MTGKQLAWILTGTAALIGILVALFFDFSFDYARMHFDEAVNLYQMQMPEMPSGTVPLDGGTEIYKLAEVKSLENPFPMKPEWVAEGLKRYGYFCRQCHGPNLEGKGTVGQSFAPLPANLKSPRVLSQSDGELFQKISYGFQRHPPLAYTVAVPDRWKIILFIRSAADSE